MNSSEDIFSLRREQFDDIKRAALESPLRRARICAHHHHEDPIQEMIIVFCKGAAIPPHKHVGKTESFHIIEGEVQIIFFDDDGKAFSQLVLGEVGSKLPFFYRLSKPLFHALVPLTDFVVLHETTLGPFDRDLNVFPTWGPEKRDPESTMLFLQQFSYSCIREHL